MSGERDEAGARALLRELVSDVRQWSEWNQVLGADALPMAPPTAPAEPARAPEPSPRTMESGPRPAAPPAPSTGESAPRSRPTFEPTRRPGPPPARQGNGILGPIRAELGDCTRCGLHEGRKNLVFGVGSETAELVIVGEAPGQQEDLTGEPFVGRSGQLLTRMLGAIGLRRDQVYICNVIKCRPPNNRDPSPEEVATCSPFLVQQVEAIGPRAVMTVGKFASQRILGLEDTMGRMRGQTHQWEGVPVVPTYHPAYLLRNPSAKRQAWEDLLRVRGLLRR